MNLGDTCTPVYGLPYATGASKPCNIGDTMCSFAEAVETQLDALDAIVAEVQGAPFAYMVNSVQQDYNNSQPSNFILTFNTTLADTDNMIDLSLNPSILTIQTPGVYSFFYDLDVVVATTATSLSMFAIVRDTVGSQIPGDESFSTLRFVSPAGMPLKTNGDRLGNVCFTAEFIANVGAGYTYSLEMFIGGPTGLVSNITQCRAGATWLREAL